VAKRLTMNTEKIIDKNLILAVIARDENWEKGLNFISEENDFVQVGFWGYDKSQKLSAHTHLNFAREVLKTQEVIFVKQGKMKADIFTEEGILLKSVELFAGDTAIFLNGGHGYEILEDNTKVLEIKNGPYVGPEKDRKRI
jgi:hypothetical protein